MRLYGMGALCSILKDREEAPGSGSQEMKKEKPHLKISKMTQLKRAGTRSEEPWRLAISKREFNSPDDYNKALEDLQLAEKERAFDAAVETSATEVERRAAEILSHIRNYD